MSSEFFIWDFDGMLFDTYPHTVEAFCVFCGRTGREYNRKEIYDLFKVNLRLGFERYGLSADEITEFYAIENDLELEPRGVPFPLIPEILKEICERGGKNFLYTHRDTVAVKYLELYSLKELFSGFVTGEDGFAYKPAPDAIEHIIKTHALEKNACLMLGDRDIDIGAGINAGIRTLLFDNENRYGYIGETIRCETSDELYNAVINELK
ncbi:MAG: HAD hydrolase-like protein [Clostridia bacterium]|nr:HAD hydrolase-like protein [Clostridia bacterium]